MNSNTTSDILTILATKKKRFVNLFDELTVCKDRKETLKSEYNLIKFEKPSKEEMELRQQNLEILDTYIENLEKIIKVKTNEI